MNDIIYMNGDVIIGYSDDIVIDFYNNSPTEDDRLVLSLIEELEKLDSELVYIHYHPQGSYTCFKLNIGKELFTV